MNREEIAKEIVTDIISQRHGQIYDDEILYDFVDAYFENEEAIIREMVDDMMQEHLDEDNLFIKE